MKYELQKKERITRIANTSVVQHSYSYQQQDSQGTNYDVTPNVSSHSKPSNSRLLMPPPPPMSSPQQPAFNVHTPEKSCMSVGPSTYTAKNSVMTRATASGVKRGREEEDQDTANNSGGSQQDQSSSDEDATDTAKPASKRRRGYFFGLF